MKLKNLRKKIRRLEKRLQEAPKKLAKLKQKLQAAEAAKAMKAARKSAACATARVEKKSPAQITATKKQSGARKPRRKRNLSPERRAQLADAMKARWAAKRAAGASTTTTSSDDQRSPLESPQRPIQTGQDGV